MISQNIQTEIDACYLYNILAEQEQNPNIANIFRQMSEIERSHALAFMAKNNISPEPFPSPSGRAKLIHLLGRILGYDFILGIMMETEKKVSNTTVSSRKKLQPGTSSISDTAHMAILKNILDTQSKVSGTEMARFEKRHKSVGGNALRAAVLGGNDGLVSNFSLIMGVAGATQGNKEVLLAGMAGLLAGALSMALGEWISVKSSQELYENQMSLELEELEVNPEGEKKEIALIYMAKGIPEDQSQKMASEIISDKNKAHEFLIKEELGITIEDLEGSAMEAAATSFILFAIGAIIPVLPYFFTSGYNAVLLSSALSAVGLFLIGATITLFTGRSIWYSGMRQVIFGLAAAAITYGIGSLIGVQIGG